MLPCCRDQYCITLSFYVYKEILIIKTFCILRLIESTASQSQATQHRTELSSLVFKWHISATRVSLAKLNTRKDGHAELVMLWLQSICTDPLMAREHRRSDCSYWSSQHFGQSLLQIIDFSKKHFNKGRNGYFAPRRSTEGFYPSVCPIKMHMDCWSECKKA